MKDLNILVPTDLTEPGNAAFKHAAQFIRKFGGSVTPFHAFEEVGGVERLLGLDTGGSYSKPGMLHRIKEHLEKKAGQEIDAGHLNEAKVASGSPAKEIVKTGREYDFIIMTGNKRTGVERITIGSTAQKIVARSHTPVIVTGTNCNLEHFDKLLILTDFSERSLQVVPYAKGLMQAIPELKAEFVHFVNVGYFTPGNNNKIIEAAEAELKKLAGVQFGDLAGRVTSQVFITSTSPAEAIINLTFSRKYSLCLMTSIGESKLKSTILGSTATSILRSVDTPVFSFRPE